MDRNGSELNQMQKIAYNLFVKGKNQKKSFMIGGQHSVGLKHRYFFLLALANICDYANL